MLDIQLFLNIFPKHGEGGNTKWIFNVGAPSLPSRVSYALSFMYIVFVVRKPNLYTYIVQLLLTRPYLYLNLKFKINKWIIKIHNKNKNSVVTIINHIRFHSHVYQFYTYQIIRLNFLKITQYRCQYHGTTNPPFLLSIKWRYCSISFSFIYRVRVHISIKSYCNNVTCTLV
jgi:hypothetical protein